MLYELYIIVIWCFTKTIERKGISCSPPVLRDTKGTHAAMAELKLIRSGWMDQDAIPWQPVALPVDAAGLLACRSILLNCWIFWGYKGRVHQAPKDAKSNHAKIETKCLASFLRKVSFSFSLPNCTFSYGTLEGSRHNLGIWLCCLLDASEEFFGATPVNVNTNRYCTGRCVKPSFGVSQLLRGTDRNPQPG